MKRRSPEEVGARHHAFTRESARHAPTAGAAVRLPRRAVLDIGRSQGRTRPTSYDDFCADPRPQQGQVQLGVFSPAAYVKARRKNLPAVAIATATRDGSPTYLGYLIVKDEGQERPLLEDLKGRSIAWVNKQSTSGYLYPRVMLQEKGIDPDSFFGEQIIANSHDKAIEMAANGDVDVAAAASPFVDPETTQTREGALKVMVVAKTERIPLDCLVVHTRIQQELARKLRAALHEMIVSSPDTALALEKSWGPSGFVKPMHPLYNQVAENLGIAG